MIKEIEIITEKEKLDINFILEFISNSYWGKGRTLKEMQTCIDNSLNFGLFINKKQVGYGRVVTDYSQFAYIMDIFIDINFRGNGYSKILIKNILEFKSVRKVKVWRLATADTHNLYKQFGFNRIKHPEKFMELIR